jgi:hypothetical protein
VLLHMAEQHRMIRILCQAGCGDVTGSRRVRRSKRQCSRAAAASHAQAPPDSPTPETEVKPAVLWRRR